MGKTMLLVSRLEKTGRDFVVIHEKPGVNEGRGAQHDRGDQWRPSQREGPKRARVGSSQEGEAATAGFGTQKAWLVQLLTALQDGSAAVGIWPNRT